MARDDTNAEMLRQALRQAGANVAIDWTYRTRTGLGKFPGPVFLTEVDGISDCPLSIGYARRRFFKFYFKFRKMPEVR